MNNLTHRLSCVFEELGFDKTVLNNKELFLHKENYYIITYISKFRSFVIEYANNFQDAKNNVFEDGDIFSIDLTEDQIIQEFREILIQYYL